MSATQQPNRRAARGSAVRLPIHDTEITPAKIAIADHPQALPTWRPHVRSAHP